jgi:hypothetical protein
VYWRVEQVKGIGADRAYELVKWRERIEAKIQAKSARVLPAYHATQRTTIQKKYQQQRQSLIQEEIAQKQHLLQKQNDLDATQTELAALSDVSFAAYLKDLF